LGARKERKRKGRRGGPWKREKKKRGARPFERSSRSCFEEVGGGKKRKGGEGIRESEGKRGRHQVTKAVDLLYPKEKRRKGKVEEKGKRKDLELPSIKYSRKLEGGGKKERKTMERGAKKKEKKRGVSDSFPSLSARKQKRREMNEKRFRRRKKKKEGGD